MMQTVSWFVERTGPDNTRHNWSNPVVADIHPVDSRTTRCNPELDNLYRILEVGNPAAVVVVAEWWQVVASFPGDAKEGY